MNIDLIGKWVKRSNFDLLLALIHNHSQLLFESKCLLAHLEQDIDSRYYLYVKLSNGIEYKRYLRPQYPVEVSVPEEFEILSDLFHLVYSELPYTDKKIRMAHFDETIQICLQKEIGR